jgi:hypothetical protein
MTSAKIVLLAVLAMIALAVLSVPARAASPAWKVVGVTGPTHLPPVASEVQQVAVDATGGTFTLTFESQTTAPLEFDASATEVAAALNGLSSIGPSGAVEVEGGPGSLGGVTPYVVRFGGSLAATNVNPIGADSSQLTGGTMTATVSTKTEGATPGIAHILPTVVNVGGVDSSGVVTLRIGPLPTGITTAATPSGGDWSCTPTGAGQTNVTCTRSASVAVERAAPRLTMQVTIGPTASPSSTVPISVEGGGALPQGSDEHLMPVTVSSVPAPPGIQVLWAGAFDADGQPYDQAGGHPARAGAFFRLNTILSPSGQIVPAGDLRDVEVEAPPGFTGNPLVTDRCPPEEPAGSLFGTTLCPLSAVVGGVDPYVQGFPAENSGTNPLYNNIPSLGYPAQFTFPYVFAEVTAVASLRSDRDYGVTVISPNVPLIYKAYGALAMLSGSVAGEAFLTNPTECDGLPVTTSIRASTWQAPEEFAGGTSDSPPMTGCDQVPFEPSVSIKPTSLAADSASGLDVDFDVPQDGLTDPTKLTTSHLKKTVVTLPEGVSVNPSGATGLAGCSDAQFGVRGYGFEAPAPVRFTNDDPFDGEGQECPDASKIGTVEVTTPVLEEKLTGDVVLGSPKSTDPASGEMFRLFLVVRNKERGILVKIHGTSTADPVTGRLRATFDSNPQLPFGKLSVKLKGGQRGILATPPGCGTSAAVSALTPWSRAHLPADQQDPVVQSSEWEVDGNCAGGFAPGLSGGMSTAKARASGAFSFRFSRGDGEQYLRGLTAELPQGLLAAVKDVPLCSSALAASGACPAGSRIGVVDAKAGSGDPFVLEEKGEVFLTEGYKGGAYGLMVKIRPVAGPFRGSMELSPIVVRQAIHVDPSTAQVSAVSDPFPLIHHGVPLRVREVTVLLDRRGFMLNPSDCAAKQIAADIASAQGTVSRRSVPFQTTGCAALPFKPKLRLALTGRRQVSTGKHPGIRAQVNQTGTGEAGIEKTVVRLPKSLALDPDNAQALCEFADGTKPDLENHCPKGSIVGRAKAVTPLLDQPLSGNVYFVKNVRTDRRTGNQIRTLPMIIVALRGEVAINLKGESSTTRAGKLVSTFDQIPDAPITQFNLNIKGGKRGILAVTRTARAKINLCTGRHTAESDMDGHNGRRHDTDIRMKTPCTRAQTKAAKRKAKRAAAKARR